MADCTRVQHLMPLMREFGTLERKRLGSGVEPLEYQRWLDLKRQIGKTFNRGKASSDKRGRARPTRLLVSYKTRQALLDAIIENIRPAGFFVPTPFAAEVGVRFLARVTVEVEGEAAEIPCVVVTSITQGAHTLSTMSMGMGLKIDKPTPAQGAAISKLFEHVLDSDLGFTG
ncbi:MAG: hypothetical protein CL908_16590 [Deltaproteobacteria bacterium]|nr:hypothetical protein [Deltaproteobacteria bacterium]